MSSESGARGSQEREFDIALGARIRSLRLAQGLSLAALAEAVGVAYQQIQKYEAGVDRVAASRLIAIARGLDTSVVRLMSETVSACEKSGRGDCDEQALVAGFRRCSAADQGFILKLASSLAQSPTSARR